MKSLSSNDSRKLFLKRAFKVEDKLPSQLVGTMNEILYKCDGLPLAIVTLASLLANKPRTEEEWKRVLNSIRYSDEKDKELQVMDKILALSYNDLPYNLKAGFLYLSMFPKVYIDLPYNLKAGFLSLGMFTEINLIERDSLVWRWIAEGFIAPKLGYTLEEVGRSYFNELINRSLIQPINVEANGEARACRVHDIVLDFIVSRSVEENFVSMSDCQYAPSPHGKIRRLSFNRSMDIEHADLSNLRSFFILNVEWTPSSLNLCVLRVLDLEGCHFPKNDDLGNLFGRLFHLRYLGLCRTNIVKLSSQIGKLKFLQTLDLRRTHIRVLPEAIVQLKGLMRLVGNGLRLPDGFGHMKALQELWDLDGCSSSLNFGLKFTQLRVLRVFFDRYGSRYSETEMNSLLASLCDLGEHSLRSVRICNETITGYTDSLVDSWCPRRLQKFVLKGLKGWFSKFPMWIRPSLSELTYLVLRVKRMEREHLYMLGKLPALLVLKLTVIEIPKDGHWMSQSEFPCLTRLDFFNIFGAGLRFEEGTMPKLEKVNLQFHADKAYSAYGGFGNGIQHLSSLQTCSISVWTKSEDSYIPEMEIASISVINNDIKLLPNHTKVDFNITRH